MKTQTHRRTSRLRAALLGALCLATAFPAHAGSPPVITGVTASQRAGTKLVDISYSISDPDSTSVNVTIAVSQDSGATWSVPAVTFSGTGAPGNNIPVTATPTPKSVVWDAGADWNGNFTTHCRVRVLASDNGMVGIPAGSYFRGNFSGDTDITDAPVYSVTVSAFFMDANLVTGSLWNYVKQSYADVNGYAFNNAGSYKAINHPVQTIYWYDAVKWCNARSQMEGRTPVYYTDAGFTTVYKTGQVAPFVKPGAGGYRLPTEAEWEKAARGGLNAQRFPWGNTISESQANYYGDTAHYSYDLGPNGYNAIGSVGGTNPATSPVGSFAANGYGLYDMAGNVFEWCWDLYASNYYAAGQMDPQGPSSGSGARVLRGGYWSGNNGVGDAYYARCANRYSFPPDNTFTYFGFRTVLAPGQ